MAVYENMSIGLIYLKIGENKIIIRVNSKDNYYGNTEFLFDASRIHLFDNESRNAI